MRRTSGEKFQKTQHEKAKAKTRKQKGKDAIEQHIATTEEIVEKTLNSLKKLGEQKFAVSPFSQYFDDWLVNVKNVLAEFESNKAIKVDEVFVKEREQITAKIEHELLALKQEEAMLSQKTKELTDNNHQIVEIDADYAAKTRELGSKRNTEIQELTKKVKEREEELENVKKMKTGLFRFTKKAKAKKEKEVACKLEEAKADLDQILQKFKVEQEKLHDDYEKNKQATIEQVQKLEQEIAKLEQDPSEVSRRNTSENLIATVNALFQRKPAFSAEPTP